MLAPTAEQDEAVTRFQTNGSLKINAFAGTGKTSTLAMIAASTSRRGAYLAFNKAIAEDARSRFPKTVECSTVHSLAFRATPRSYKHDEKMTGRVNVNALAQLLEFKDWSIDRDHKLSPRAQAFLVQQTLRRFMQGATSAPLAIHVPLHGRLAAAPEATVAVVREFTLKWALYVWERMKDPLDKIPLGHDGYQKLWALSEPRIAAEFILLDEAQDTNPVVLDVLRRQPAQMIYVGDKYQQIYEWRGAVNAMEQIATNHSTYLTTSFRFGQVIATTASTVLAHLGEAKRIAGNPAIESRVGGAKPHAILSRTNASAMTAIIEALDQGHRPHLIGGNDEIMNMLRGVRDLKRAEASIVPEFFGFANWAEVVEFAKSSEGQHLLTFVNLVEARGEGQLMWALNKTVPEDASDFIVSTAHKAKGREWKTVRLMDDFLKSKPMKETHETDLEKAEVRLFYVALTRAREAIEVAPEHLALFGLPAARYSRKEPNLQPTPAQASSQLSTRRPIPSYPQSSPRQTQPAPQRMTPQSTPSPHLVEQTPTAPVTPKKWWQRLFS